MWLVSIYYSINLLINSTSGIHWIHWILPICNTIDWLQNEEMIITWKELSVIKDDSHITQNISKEYKTEYFDVGFQFSTNEDAESLP